MIAPFAMLESRPDRLPFFVHRCVRSAEAVLAEAGVGNQAVLLGVSGGGDSMALLEIVGLLAAKLGLGLHVACVDHGMRPEAAAEARLVRDAALRWQAAFHPVAVDSAGSDEDSLRNARHAALAEIARNNSCRFILLGHTSDDQVETVVFRFLRGAGLGGLAGMRAVSPPLVRPLLSIARDDLRRVLRARGVAWAEDASNLSGRYARGRLRTAVLPAIEAAFGHGAIAHLLDVAPRWRADEDYLETEAGRLLAYASRRSDTGAELDLEALASGHAALRPRVLRLWVSSMTSHAPGSRDIAAIERWLGNAGKETGSLDLAGARLSRRGGRLRITRTSSSREAVPVRIDIASSSDDPSQAPGDDEGGDALPPENAVLPPSEGRVRFPRN